MTDPNIAKNFDKVAANCLIVQWEKGNEADSSVYLKNNITKSLTTTNVAGVAIQYFNGKPASAMSDPEFYAAAIPNTELEGVEASAQEMTFVRKLAFEITGEPNDILDQTKFVAKVVNHATDDNKVLHLDDIYKAVRLAWDSMYPGQELDGTIHQFAYFITTEAIVNYHSQNYLF